VQEEARIVGRTIDLPDESATRIICFDAFYHALNLEASVDEFSPGMEMKLLGNFFCRYEPPRDLDS